MNDDLSIDDDFLNLRFDPKFKQIFKEKIESLEGQAFIAEYLIPVNFVGSYPDKTQKLLNTMVNRVVRSAGASGLRLRKSDPEIVFFTEKAWKKNKTDQLNLPASNINWQGTQPTIQVITPPSIESSETLIKTVRLLFSKLFGTLFFNENVLSRKPYFVDKDQSPEKSFDTIEKLHFTRLQDDYTASTLEHFQQLAINKKLSREKQIESGKNEFFRLLGSETNNPNSLYVDILNSEFSKYYKFACQDSNQFFERVTEKLFAALPKLGLVLPHEMRFYINLQERSQWQLFDGIAEKAQYIKGSIEDLTECFNYLENLNGAEVTDYSIPDYWTNVLNNRIVYLKRKGLVKLFLIEDSRLTLNQQKDALEFPLWVWRQRLFENYPKTVGSNKVLGLITNHYKNSIYQKILEAAFRAISCLKMLQGSSPSTISKSKDYKRLQSLIAGINVRIPILDDILHTCRIAPQLIRNVKVDQNDITKKSQQFETGWAYFISFALIHQFYLSKQSISNDKASKFLLIIKGHLERKLEKQFSSQISYLLLLLYINAHYDLERIIEVVIKGSETLDFFVLNKHKIKNKKLSDSEMIQSYSKGILK